MAAGLTSAGLEQVREAAERHVGDTRVPGLVALVARGEDVHVEALGSLTIGGPSARRDSLFRLASTTKPLTGAATLAVVEEGLIGLDEPVERLLPELAERRVLRRMDGPLNDTAPAARAITLRDLLTFTFGFGQAAGMYASPMPGDFLHAGRRWPVVAAADELGLSTFGVQDPDVQPDPDTWIANLGALPLLAQPGERWLYNTGAQVLACFSLAPPGSRSPRCSARACSTPLGCAIQPSGHLRPTASELPTSPHRTGSWCGTSRTAAGAGHPRSRMVPGDWSRQSTIC
jgi:CubicO group peptidase (beta-lactamase class C family)